MILNNYLRYQRYICSCDIMKINGKNKKAGILAIGARIVIIIFILATLFSITIRLVSKDTSITVKNADGNLWNDARDGNYNIAFVPIGEVTYPIITRTVYIDCETDNQEKVRLTGGVTYHVYVYEGISKYMIAGDPVLDIDYYADHALIITITDLTHITIAQTT